ncbi:sigma-70 family RNA polymerase sigma factor [Lentibacillus sp. CBA3610]|uniref:sigma-70 family RNA polymerase sigma factor n=1 Tax=Lentibacillus sp. CBA3610 TaxID=2518176 RepID=UPI00159565F3|nr:sigma-70 family RNA polymerase sigma factor [Lentibacillus sp. CBA3610]QKY70240.1 sigma-70 family RNA polymerase sigma factor [Lentibacillus sp. CBA3610]
MRDGNGERYITFEEIFNQNERRIYYYIHRLNIQDPHQEFYQEGLVVMWNAYEKYRPEKGSMATYFNYIIRNRMIDLMRKENNELYKLSHYANKIGRISMTGMIITAAGRRHSVAKNEVDVVEDHATFWREVRDQLSENQWKWVQHHIIEDKPLRELTEQEGVTVEAVKSWGERREKEIA